MRMKTVTRYNCDFCNKRGFSASHMTKHERHCTLNPNRDCRVCALLENGWDADFERKTLPELIAMLPDPGQMLAVDCCDTNNEYRKMTEALEAVLPAFRDATGGCPACMMAALRQAKIPVPMMEGFDFKQEMQNIMDSINEAREENRYY